MTAKKQRQNLSEQLYQRFQQRPALQKIWHYIDRQMLPIVNHIALTTMRRPDKIVPAKLFAPRCRKMERKSVIIWNPISRHILPIRTHVRKFITLYHFSRIQSHIVSSLLCYCVDA